MRVQSPSSILTYKQCPRKYYYSYIKKIPAKTNIHLLRGNAVHSAIENFFDVDIDDLETNSSTFLQNRLLALFRKEWKKIGSKIQKLELSDEQIRFYFEESEEMLSNWFKRFYKKLQALIEKGSEFSQAFKTLTPLREQEYISTKHSVRGFIDAILQDNGKTILIDYKTSKNPILTDAYRLQLAIYALLYNHKHGLMPDFVGIDFLKAGEQFIPVEQELVKEAEFEIEQIHASTDGKEKEDYPQNITPLCKWKTGQCDFYDHCFPK